MCTSIITAHHQGHGRECGELREPWKGVDNFFPEPTKDVTAMTFGVEKKKMSRTSPTQENILGKENSFEKMWTYGHL